MTTDDRDPTNDSSKSRSDDRSQDTSRSRSHRQRRHGPRRADGRKERVLHTRISEQLSEDIRRLADDLRVPTSNLVRNVLEEVFTMVESVTEDVGEIFDDVLDEAEGTRDRIRRRAQRSRGRQRRHTSHGRRPDSDDNVERELKDDEVHEGAATSKSSAPPPEPEVEHRPQREFPDVIGWQPLVLNNAQACANCSVDLPRGSRAFVGVGAGGLTPTTLCRPCTGAR
jgi:hypothetical protein